MVDGIRRIKSQDGPGLILSGSSTSCWAVLIAAAPGRSLSAIR